MEWQTLAASMLTAFYEVECARYHNRGFGKAANIVQVLYWIPELSCHGCISFDAVDKLRYIRQFSTSYTPFSTSTHRSAKSCHDLTRLVRTTTTIQACQELGITPVLESLRCAIINNANTNYCYYKRTMELYPLKVFLSVVNEKSFSRAAEKMLRTQPAISLAVQRLETELGERLIDRSGTPPILTDAGRIVADYARRFENLEAELQNSLSELRDNSAGRLIIGANESTSLYLLRHIEQYRRLYPKVKVQVRRSFSSKIPTQLLDGDLELGVISYDPQDERLVSKIIFTDHLAFVVSPQHRFAKRKSVSIAELGMETFIAHNVLSPYREVVLREFQRHKVQLNMDVEMPTVETIRRLVQRNEGVAFIPQMCVEQELEQKMLYEVKVPELEVARKIRLVYPSRRALSHAAKAFLEIVKG